MRLRSANAHPETTEPFLGGPRGAPTTPYSGCSAAPAQPKRSPSAYPDWPKAVTCQPSTLAFCRLRIGTRSGRPRWREEGAGRMRVGRGAKAPGLPRLFSMQSSSPGLECGPLGVPGASARIQWKCGKVPALPNTSSHPLPMFQANLQGCLELLKSSKATFTV